MDGMNLQGNSVLRIGYIVPLNSEGIGQLLEKSQLVRFYEKFMPTFSHETVGTDITLSALEKAIAEEGLNAFEDRRGRALYSLPEFSVDDYVTIRKVGQGNEGDTGNGVYMYMRRVGDENRLLVGLFSFNGQTVEDKADYAAIGFRMK